MNELKILELFKNQTCWVDSIVDTTGVGFAENTHCGDEIQFQITQVNGVVSKIIYSGRACSMTLASAEYIARTYTGGSIPNRDNMVEMLQAAFEIDEKHRRIRCVMLPVDAFYAALRAE